MAVNAFQNPDIDQERLKGYFWAQPSLTPDDPSRTMICCVNPPGAVRSNARLKAWRDRVVEHCARWPGDEVWPLFLRQVTLCLEWRETVPPDYRFWQADSEGPQQA